MRGLNSKTPDYSRGCGERSQNSKTLGQSSWFEWGRATAVLKQKRSVRAQVEYLGQFFELSQRVGCGDGQKQYADSDASVEREIIRYVEKQAELCRFSTFPQIRVFPPSPIWRVPVWFLAPELDNGQRSRDSAKNYRTFDFEEAYLNDHARDWGKQ